MKIYDRTERMKFGNDRFPVLKGHVKLTLRNVHNGKTEVIEGENIVTDAVKDIFENNCMGGIDYSKMMPLWSKWYGGVLAYEQAHANLDADKYYMNADSAQKLIAHAGQAGIDVQHDDDLRAGNPTSSSFIQTENSMKQVWEWGTTHGNGTIRALSLCHTDIGDAGTGGTNYRFQNLSPFDDIKSSILPNSDINNVAPDNFMAQYDDNHGLFYHIGEPSDWVLNKWCASMETTKITVCIRRLPYSKSGLFETFHGRSGYDREFTVEISGVTGFSKLYMQPSFYFDYATKKLWLFANNTSTVRYASPNVWDNQHVHCIVIDCENEVIDDEFLITSDTSDLVPLCEGHDPEDYNVDPPTSSRVNTYVVTGLAKDGNYVYFPTGTLSNPRSVYGQTYSITGYKKINIDPQHQSDQESISFAGGVSQTQIKSTIKAGELLVNSGVVVNGTGYACQSSISESIDRECFYGTWCFQNPTKPSFLVLPVGCGNKASTTSWTRYFLANKFLNTTKYNLPSAITKTASQSMTIEYTLTEV